MAYLGMGAESSFANELASQQLNLANIANKRAATEHQYATADYVRAMSREANVRAQGAEEELAANQQIAQLDAIASEGLSPEQRQDPTQMLNVAAGVYAKAGLLKRAAEMLKLSSTINAQTARAGAAQASADARTQNANRRSLDDIQTQLGNTTSQEGWDLVKQSILAQNPDLQGYVDRLGDYSPEKAAALQAAMTKYRDKEFVENARRRTDIYERVSNARAEQIAAKGDIDKEKLEISRRRADAYTKNLGNRGATAGGRGGKTPTAAGMPSKAEVTSVADQLSALGVKADASDHQEIAQEAKIRWKANPGLTPAQAQAQVIQERIASGDIKPGTVEKKSTFFGLGPDKDVKKPGIVFSSTKPAAWPAKLEDAVKGQYYIAPNGIVHQYQGNNYFEPVK